MRRGVPRELRAVVRNRARRSHAGSRTWGAGVQLNAPTLLDRARAAGARQLFAGLYGTLAPAYDRVSAFFFAGQWSVWQQCSLEFVRGCEVLDLGYGTGSLLIEMCRKGHRATGVDASHRMCHLANRKLRSTGCSARIMTGRASALPFADGSFSTVVSTFPSSYILDPATWREAHRVLQPGGVFVVVLSGELLPCDHRSKLLIKFHTLVYGSQTGPPRLRDLEPPGFTVRYTNRSNGRGVAHILIAEKTCSDMSSR